MNVCRKYNGFSLNYSAKSLISRTGLAGPGDGLVRLGNNTF